MKYLESPNNCNVSEFVDMQSIFLAGGIFGCEPWQFDFAKRFEDTNLFVVNPRRKKWGKEENEARRQIKWEYFWLNNTEAVSFWFAPETTQPITLYELGRMIDKKYTIFVGMHPNYERKFDVEVQVELARPDIEIVYNLDQLENQIRRWLT